MLRSYLPVTAKIEPVDYTKAFAPSRKGKEGVLHGAASLIVGYIERASIERWDPSLHIHGGRKRNT